MREVWPGLQLHKLADPVDALRMSTSGNSQTQFEFAPDARTAAELFLFLPPSNM